MKNSKKGNRQEPKIWYKLDLSAIVYPTLQRRDFSSVYRLSVVLKEPVKADILQQAADIALTRFPTYKTAIGRDCSGVIWSQTTAQAPLFRRISAIFVCLCPLKQAIAICSVFIIMAVESL